MSKNGISGLGQLDDLMKQLAKMGENIDANIMNNAIKAGAEVAKDKIENHPNMPVSKKNKEHAKDHIAIVKVSDEQYDIGVEEDFFYLLFHEIGTSEGTYKSKNGNEITTPSIDAKPFMRPGFESNEDKIQEAMAKVIKRGLRL